ncbi:MAG: hypothetical protein M1821_003827 [Bathelium mastoideum]|nr:MAG: hypothetical protein M1821_003827 [Bathelium mastoideum]
MASYKVDPDGDVILVFENPQPAFNVQDDLEEHESYTPDRCLTCAIDDSDAESDTPEPEIASVTVPNPVDSEAEPNEPTEVWVSSRHLMLASPYFQRALSSNWIEGNSLQTQGSVRMALKDWDLEAMLILMNIIHGRVRSVPKTLPLEMLARMTVLIDFYGCNEAVEVFTDMWIADLSSTVPTTYSRDAVLWLCISSVFRRSTEFRISTSLALRHSKGPVPTLGLPIKSRIIDDIEQQRHKAVERLFRALDNLLDMLYHDRHGCSFECRAMLIGAISKEMHTRKLFKPTPREPFFGLSFATTVESIRRTRNPEWWATNHGGYPRDSRPHSCSLRDEIDPIIASLEKQMTGLKIECYN